MKCLGLPIEKLKRPRKPKKEGERKKKIVREDQLFASRSPSPQASNASSEEESDAKETEDEEDIEPTPTSQHIPTENNDNLGNENNVTNSPPKKKAFSKYRQSLRQPAKETSLIEDDSPDENSKPASQSNSQQLSLRRIVESDESENENSEVLDTNQEKMLTNTSKRFIDSDDDEINTMSQKKRQKIVDDED